MMNYTNMKNVISEPFDSPEENASTLSNSQPAHTADTSEVSKK